MNIQADHDSLLIDAARADLALDERANTFYVAQRELVQLRRRAAGLQGIPAWLAACDRHGGPDEAIEAARAEVEQARQYLATLESLHVESNALRDRVTAALRAVDQRLIAESNELHMRGVTLESQLKTAEATREANVRAMVKLGAEEPTARSVARPTLAEIADLRVELAQLPALKERNARLLASHVERARLACA